jgi:hypothetical protein
MGVGGAGAVELDDSGAEEVGALAGSDAPTPEEAVALALDELATSAPAEAAQAASDSAAIRDAAVAAPRVHRFSACIPCLRTPQVTSG